MVEFVRLPGQMYQLPEAVTAYQPGSGSVALSAWTIEEQTRSILGSVPRRGLRPLPVFVKEFNLATEAFRESP
jgi:hypothetical protein